MELAAKLQIPAGTGLRVLNLPSGLVLGIPRGKDTSEGLLFFASNSSVLKKNGTPAIVSARADRLTWIAYPKAGQLGTDLNRDRLCEILKPEGIRPVRQVSLDETWSALRFRPQTG